MTRPVRFHVEDRLHLSPDWAVVGMRYSHGDNRVLLIASRTLDYATLVQRSETMLDELYTYGQITPAPALFTLSAGLDNVVLAMGVNYSDAFVKLLKEWDPDQPDGTPLIAIEGTVVDDD